VTACSRVPSPRHFPFLSRFHEEMFFLSVDDRGVTGLIPSSGTRLLLMSLRELSRQAVFFPSSQHGTQNRMILFLVIAVAVFFFFALDLVRSRRAAAPPSQS